MAGVSLKTFDLSYFSVNYRYFFAMCHLDQGYLPVQSWHIVVNGEYINCKKKSRTKFWSYICMYCMTPLSSTEGM